MLNFLDADTRKVLQKCFATELGKSLPDFRAATIKSKYLFPGHRPFVRKVDATTWLLIILIPHHAGARKFTVEIGWSRLGRFPELSARPSPESPKEALALKLEEYVCRLGKITEGVDKWWLLPSSDESMEGLRSKVESVVSEAIGDLVADGIPYLNHFLNSIQQA